MLQPITANAGAWVLDEGKFKIIPSYNFYYSDEYFDSSGSSQNSKKFIKNELALNFEYGLNQTTTIGLTPFFTALNAPRSHNSNRNQALSSFEIYTRHKLGEHDGFVFSIEPKLKLPGLYEADSTPNMGSRTVDLEIAFNVGKNHNFYSLGGFSDVRVAYGNYIDKFLLHDANPYIKADFTIAVEFLPTWLIMPKLYTNFSMHDAPTNMGAGNIVNPKNYTLIKPELNLVKRIGNDASIQLGYYQDIYGENTGKGHGFSGSLWLDF
jgi:hypothetical protein